MKTLIANKPLVYASRNYAANEEFRAANAHCLVLVASGLAREAEAKPPEKIEPLVPRRAYRRRDMRAEE